jgi:UDP-N-acetylglucosamine 2-epimerase (non-hydrolysing)
MKKILCLVGTRPECIKMAPVIKALKGVPWAETMVLSTGQHRELAKQALEIFGLAPDADLNVMQPNQTLSLLSANIFGALDPILSEHQPDLLLAQGDTTSVAIAALASFHRKIPFAHVEAGLRTGDLENPFPEELNRIIADRVAKIHFVPTEGARQNLLAEGTLDHSIFVTGNTVIDALLDVLSKDLRCIYPIDSSRKLVLVTAHRRENFGEPFERIVTALRDLHDMLHDAEFVYPVHPNPNVRSIVQSALSGLNRFHIIEPVDYETMAGLMKAARLVVTDSGGVQEEAPALGKPVLVLRNETERPEAVAAGVAKLIGTQTHTIVEEVSNVFQNEAAYKSMARGISPYGDGRAAARIVAACGHFLKVDNVELEAAFCADE